jgi:hypothetical protein
MTREDIIRMAREAGCKPFRSPEHWDDVQVFATPNVLERFAALVAAAERESVAASSKRDLTCVCGAVWDGEQMVHAPRKREWVGLTDEDIAKAVSHLYDSQTARNMGLNDDVVTARAIEAKLKEKNGG